MSSMVMALATIGCCPPALIAVSTSPTLASMPTELAGPKSSAILVAFGTIRERRGQHRQFVAPAPDRLSRCAPAPRRRTAHLRAYAGRDLSRGAAREGERQTPLYRHHRGRSLRPRAQDVSARPGR